MVPGFAMPDGATPPTGPTTPFERARKHKPRKQMRKLNWIKVPKNATDSPTALWHPSTKGGAGLKVIVDPEGVEVLFSRAVVEKKKPKGEEEEKKKSSVVSLIVRN